jgi:hypothetical protein
MIAVPGSSAIRLVVVIVDDEVLDTGLAGLVVVDDVTELSVLVIVGPAVHAAASRVTTRAARIVLTRPEYETERQNTGFLGRDVTYRNAYFRALGARKTAHHLKYPSRSRTTIAVAPQRVPSENS